MSKLTKEYDRLANEARNLKEKPYLFFPDGLLIPRAKGTLKLIKK
jgi:hypothetical protein